MKNNSRTRSSRQGFSLLEMLTTIAIIGIMISIAMPWFGGSGQQVKQARDQRNAQTFCSLCQAAQAAGVELVASAEDEVEILRTLVTGVRVEKGVLKGRVFMLPHVGEEELLGAAKYVKISDGSLVYSSTSRASEGGSQTESNS